MGSDLSEDTGVNGLKNFEVKIINNIFKIIPPMTG